VERATGKLGAEDAGQHQAENLGAATGRGQPRQLRQHGPALAFAQHGDGVARLERAAAQDGLERVQPRGLYGFLQHAVEGSGYGHNT
jgi:hypothetical protein